MDVNKQLLYLCKPSGERLKLNEIILVDLLTEDFWEELVRDVRASQMERMTSMVRRAASFVDLMESLKAWTEKMDKSGNEKRKESAGVIGKLIGALDRAMKRCEPKLKDIHRDRPVDPDLVRLHMFREYFLICLRFHRYVSACLKWRREGEETSCSELFAIVML
jgi:hypothetical protein